MKWQVKLMSMAQGKEWNSENLVIWVLTRQAASNLRQENIHVYSKIKL